MKLYFDAANVSIQVTEDPAELAVSEFDMKRQLNLSDDDDSIHLAAVGAQAQEHIEAVLGRALIDQEWTVKLSGFPVEKHQLLGLPGGLVTSVVSVTYVDEDDEVQTLPVENYALAGIGIRTVSALEVLGREWPTVADTALPVTVVYRVGYADAASVPPTLTGCIKQLAASLFDASRGAFVDKPYDEALWYRSMLANWRIRRFG
jgi:uncharacterized phiE125 gp8 family phage protein